MVLSGLCYGRCQRIYPKRQISNGYSGNIRIKSKNIKFQLRGAPLSDKERKELNFKAGRLILRSLGIFIGETKFDVLREKHGYVGYANYYLRKCWDDSELKNKADVTIYKQLLEIDSKLGTTQSEQLYGCVLNSLRMDLIKV